MGTQGVCVIAMGNPCHGVLAYNLAVTIKYRDPKCRIAVFYEPRAFAGLEPLEVSVFDELIELGSQHAPTCRGRINPVGFKLRAPLFSPYERTIFLDVRSAWFGHRPVSSYFDCEMSGLDWACRSHGVARATGGRNDDFLKLYHDPIREVQEAFEVPAGRTIHVCRTQWLYTRRCDATLALMNRAASLYDEGNPGRRARNSALNGSLFGDELALSAATALCDTAPGRIPFNPITDGNHYELSKDQVVVNVVDSVTGKSKVALSIYAYACDLIRDSDFRWLPRPWPLITDELFGSALDGSPDTPDSALDRAQHAHRSAGRVPKPGV